METLLWRRQDHKEHKVVLTQKTLSCQQGIEMRVREVRVWKKVLYLAFSGNAETVLALPSLNMTAPVGWNNPPLERHSIKMNRSCSLLRPRAQECGRRVCGDFGELAPAPKNVFLRFHRAAMCMFHLDWLKKNNKQKLACQNGIRLVSELDSHLFFLIISH